MPISWLRLKQRLPSLQAFSRALSALYSGRNSSPRGEDIVNRRVSCKERAGAVDCGLSPSTFFRGGSGKRSDIPPPSSADP